VTVRLHSTFVLNVHLFFFFFVSYLVHQCQDYEPSDYGVVENKYDVHIQLDLTMNELTRVTLKKIVDEQNDYLLDFHQVNYFTRKRAIDKCVSCLN